VIQHIENKFQQEYGQEKVYLETMCDANGNFILKNVPYGNYGIVTNAIWDRVEVPSSRYGSPYTVKEGGNIGKLIIVDDNLQKVYITETIQ
jgi:hypothetical protein